jgi:hypothetical protein
MARRGWTRRSRRPCACVEVPSARTGNGSATDIESLEGAPRGVSDSESNPIDTRRGWEATPQSLSGRSANVTGGNTKMHVDRKSDGSVLPAKSAKKGGPETPAECMEERAPVERNTEQAGISRTQSRINGMRKGLAWYAQIGPPGPRSVRLKAGVV